MSEAEYWKKVACWMGDVMAATADGQISRSRTSKSEKERQAAIVRIAADALEGGFHQWSRGAADVVERLRRVGA